MIGPCFGEAHACSTGIRERLHIRVGPNSTRGRSGEAHFFPRLPVALHPAVWTRTRLLQAGRLVSQHGGTRRVQSLGCILEAAGPSALGGSGVGAVGSEAPLYVVAVRSGSGRIALVPPCGRASSCRRPI